MVLNNNNDGGDDDDDVNETVTECFTENRSCSGHAYNILFIIYIRIATTSSLLNRQTAAKWDEE